MVATKPMTFEEFETMPDGGKRYELVDGELREVAAAGLEHSDMGVNLAADLVNHVRPGRLGRVYGADAGFRIFPDRDLVYMPDVAFVAAERVAAIERYERTGDLAPDLAVEIVSPSDRMSQVLDKVRDYLAAGVRLVWVIHPRKRHVAAYVPDATPRIYLEQDTLDGGAVLPDFRLPVRQIFAVP